MCHVLLTKQLTDDVDCLIEHILMQQYYLQHEHDVFDELQVILFLQVLDGFGIVIE